MRQTPAKALRELRKPRTTKLHPFLPGVEIYEGGIDSFNRTWTSSTERAALSMAESMEIEERRREKHTDLLDKIRAMAAKVNCCPVRMSANMWCSGAAGMRMPLT